MCDPISLTVLAVGGTALSIYGQNKSKEASVQYNNYLADLSEKQAGAVAQTGRLQRRMITEGASRAAQKAAVASFSLQGAQRAAAAGAGLGGGSVTSENLATDEATKASLDDLYVRLQADTQKFLNKRDEDAQIENLYNQATGYRMGASNANIAGNINMASSLLSGAGQVANIWYRK